MGRLQIQLSEHRRGHVDKDPALTVDSSGRFWVAWHGYRPKEDRILVRSIKDQRRGSLLPVSEEGGSIFSRGLRAGAVQCGWCGALCGRDDGACWPDLQTKWARWCDWQKRMRVWLSQM